MMPIRCEGVGKRFLRGTVAQRISHWRPWRPAAPADWFWALEQVALTVPHAGQRIGVIGTNGSGKTTLLRILAGVTAPTCGTVRVHGRVAPVLEPVAGLQPDLTGRENVHLIGTILGMRRREIQRKFDAIVAFAGVEAFLDMPLKHYSLGMTMRLGFSTAIHVDAGIILVDEAWSIGDAAFQAKSIERVQQIQAQGVTSLIVSHDLAIVRQLTTDALWLRGGRIAAFGPTESVIRAYVASTQAPPPPGPRLPSGD